MEQSKKRIDWIDVAKFFAIYAVFIGHYINSDGTYMGGEAEYICVGVAHSVAFFLIGLC